jgi:glucose/arabinose dehydrogenase
MACALLLLAACSDSKNGPKDAPPNTGDGQPSDGTAIDAPALAACANPVTGTTISLELVTAVGNDGAMIVTAPPADPRMFFVERNGTVEIYENAAIRPTPFLDVNNVIASDTGQGERGLLGLAFHPQYATNRQFFIYYTTNAANIVARCTTSATDPNVADPSCVPILTIPDFAANHNGGMIEFGPDGFLYISTGDGGGGDDPALNGQSLVDGAPCPGAANCVGTRVSQAWLGKMLRIDVDNPANGKMYGIPGSNPFAAGGGKPEIYAYGLRNPWRWSFDAATGDIWIGDVGQSAIEEIDYVPAGRLAGKNFGWPMYEGSACHYGPCDPTNKFVAQIQHPRSQGYNAIIGGQVYRGTCFPSIQGWYFYSDNGRRRLSRAIVQSGGAIDAVELPMTLPAGPASIHADARGELYLTTITAGGGNVYRIVAGP